ncbi:VanZ like family protein [Salinibacillus kushneri]|uniref:VanZ like family protein n=1 Tax=Salinibacillus kushneri TaxID=237682 RepID=A0A1H9YSS8_9BACI|nr:VanZ family protein [Salinibacillus kushneri]SES72146.1 VanZ like family protein [Salinibacillus kushneri]
MRKWWLWGLPIIWMGVIFYSSSQPYEEQDLKPFFSEYADFSFLQPIANEISFVYHDSEVSVQALGINGFVEFFIRKGAHFGVYFILFLLFVVAFQKATRLATKWILFCSFLLTVTYAVFDEIHQGMTPGRTPYIGDVFIDATGGLFGMLVFVLISNYLRKKRKIKEIT